MDFLLLLLLITFITSILTHERDADLSHRRR